MTTSDDTERLLASVVPPATELLRAVGQLVPHGAAIASDGDLVDVSALDAAEDAHDQPLVEVLKERLRNAAAAGQVRATAIVFDAHVELSGATGVSDAIAVAIDHRDGSSVLVVRPYTRGDDGLTFGDEFRQSGDGDIFT